MARPFPTRFAAKWNDFAERETRQYSAGNPHRQSLQLWRSSSAGRTREGFDGRALHPRLFGNPAILFLDQATNRFVAIQFVELFCRYLAARGPGAVLIDD